MDAPVQEEAAVSKLDLLSALSGDKTADRAVLAASEKLLFAKGHQTLFTQSGVLKKPLAGARKGWTLLGFDWQALVGRFKAARGRIKLKFNRRTANQQSFDQKRPCLSIWSVVCQYAPDFVNFDVSSSMCSSIVRQYALKLRHY